MGSSMCSTRESAWEAEARREEDLGEERGEREVIKP